MVKEGRWMGGSGWNRWRANSILTWWALAIELIFLIKKKKNCGGVEHRPSGSSRISGLFDRYCLIVPHKSGTILQFHGQCSPHQCEIIHPFPPIWNVVSFYPTLYCTQFLSSLIYCQVIEEWICVSQCFWNNIFHIRMQLIFIGWMSKQGQH